MSFDQLMQHAQEIQQAATQAAFRQNGVRPLNAPEQPQFSPRPGENEKRRAIEVGFADVSDLFVPFSEMPDPTTLEQKAAILDTVLHKLSQGNGTSANKNPISGLPYFANTALDAISSASSHIEDWTGVAAIQFKENFIDTFQSTVYNQFLVASIVRAALDAQREIWIKTRDDIDKIAHDTLIALDRMDECGRNEWTMTFTVVASVAAIAAAPLSGGTSLALVAVSSAAQVVAAAAPDDPPTVRFGGESAEAVISSMREAITMLHGYIQDQERKIFDALTETYRLVSQNREQFVARRPALANATRENVTGPLFMGYST